MATRVGPNTFGEENLAFSYDIDDRKNSFIGKPTTNYIAELGDPSIEYARGEFGQYFNLVPIFETYGLVPYSLSMDIKGSKPGYCSVYMQNSSYTKYAFVSTAVNITTEYQRYTFQNITPSGPTSAWLANTPSDNRAMLATYTVYGSGRNPTVKNIQLELGPISTPFTASSRSSTQGLLDLTGRSMINLVNSSYDSNGNLIFDGTDDFATVNLSSSTEVRCLELVWYNNNAIPNNDTPIGGPSTYQTPIEFNGNGTGVHLGAWTGGLTNEAIHIWSGGGATSSSVAAPVGYHHVIFNWNQPTYDIWLDGVKLSTSYLSGYLPATLISTSTIKIGSDVNNYVFNGRIQIAKIYTRSLLNSEIQTNFAVAKKRFNI